MSEHDTDAPPPGWKPQFLSDEDFIVIRDHRRVHGHNTMEQTLRIQEDRLARCQRGIATLRSLGTVDAMADADFLEQAVRHAIGQLFQRAQQQRGLKGPKITAETLGKALKESPPRKRTVTAIAKKLRVSRTRLSEKLRDHPELDWRKK